VDGRDKPGHDDKIGDPMSKPPILVTLALADYSPKHFLLAVVDGVRQRDAESVPEREKSADV